MRKVLPHRGMKWTRLPGSALQAPPDVFVLRERLSQRIDWWKSAGACKQVLRTLRSGARLEFKTSPRPFTMRSIPVKPQHKQWVHQELDRAIARGAFEEASCLDFVAPAFIVEQKDKLRLVMDFTGINKHCINMSCKYEGLKDLRYLLQKGDWMFSLDLTDAYWHIPVAVQHRKYLTFNVDGRILQCSAIPFGWTGSPLTFTKVMRAFVRYLRSRGIRCLPYVDDLAFFVSGSFSRALKARQIVEEALFLSGLSRKPSKGQWEPSHCLHDHLGMTVDSITGTISAPPRRCAAVSALARDVLCRAARHCRRVPSELLRRFTGTAVSLSLALRSARFRLRSVFDCLHRYKVFSTLSRQALTDIQWWTELHAAHPENGMPIWPPPTSRTLWADASGDTGWGAQLRFGGSTLHAHGYWRRGTEAALHITAKELKTLRLALISFLPEVRGQHILLWEDNMPVVHIVCNGTSRSPELMQELRLLWGFLAKHNITLLPRYIRSEDNPADFWSRWQDRSAWTLNPLIFDRIHRLHGPFTLDVFACRATAQLPRYCSLRADPGALARDGFSVEWSNEVVWLNPPWELLPQTLYKLRTEGAKGVIVAPFWPSQSWWPDLLRYSTEVLPLGPTRWCVRGAHDGLVEPRLHPRLKLFAFKVDGSLAH